MSHPTGGRRVACAPRRYAPIESLESRTLLSVELVRDINAQPVPTPTTFGQFTDVNGTLFFAGADANGTELWKSDGTAAGTTRVTDLVPGRDSSAPAQLTNLNGTLLFTAIAPGLGRWLWRSDGTQAGTYRLASAYPPATEYIGGPPYRIVTGGGAAWFFTSGNAGRQLWRTDGTVAGTRPVATIPPLTPNSTGMSPRGVTYLNGTLFFTVDGDAGGIELWKSDGTQAGTARVKDINPGPGSSGATKFTPVGNTLYFVANDGTSGMELWKSDGTEAGTVRVKDIRPGSAWGLGASPNLLPELAALGDTLFFTANDGVTGTELWKSDGTEAGTVLVGDINQAGGPAANSTPTNLTALDGVLYFAATEATTGRELWRSDGTAAGTRMVFDFSPGPPGAGSQPPTEIVTAGGSIYLTTTLIGSNWTRLWKSDGTTAGTTELRSFPVTTQSLGPPQVVGMLTSVGPTVFFAGWEEATGLELWKTDGTPGGTAPVKDVHNLTGFSSPGYIGTLDGKLFFAAGPSDNRDLWVSDGTPGGTHTLNSIVNLPDLGPVPGLGGGLVIGNNLYFAGGDSNGTELWKTDGTVLGTGRVKNVAPDVFPPGNIRSSNPSQFTYYNGLLFFTQAREGGLWRSDGTEAGTVPVFESGAPDTLQIIGVVGGRLLFGGWGPPEAGSTTRRFGLWSTDGTPQGTTLLRELGRPSSGVADWASVRFQKLDDGAAVFFAPDVGPGSNETKLWRTDGTAAGTAVVADLLPGLDFDFGAAGVVNGKMYFGAADDTLWVTDGTAAGTRKVADVKPSALTRFVGLGDSAGAGILFGVETASTPTRVVNLYRTDGTDAGTVPVAGLLGSPLRRIGDHVYVAGALPPAQGGSAGIWKTDGTDAGTTLVSPLTGGIMDALGGWIYSNAQDATLGRELWRISLEGAAPPTVTSAAFDAAAAGPGPQRLTFQLSNDVRFDRISAQQLLLSNLDTGASVSSFRVVRAYDPATRTVSFTFPYEPGGRLPGGRWRATLPPGAVASAATGDPLATAYAHTFTAPGVVARHLFYNNSAFDGFDPAADARDDAAIATDKPALRANTGPGFMHASSYSRGINGLMVDIANLPAGSVLSADDFVFEMGGGSPTGWRPAPAPSSVTVRRGAGVGGSDRVTITFPDFAIRNTWLRVTVKPASGTGAGLADVFQFGNLVGETGNDRSGYHGPTVNVLDAAATRRARLRQTQAGGVVPVTSPFDHNRDGRIDATDELIARRRSGTLPIDVEFPPPPMSVTLASPTRTRSAYRPLPEL